MRGFDHQGADGVVGEQDAPDFLPHHLRGFRAEYAGVCDLVGFDLVQGDLEFPALVVGGGQVGGERFVPVGDGGDQPVDLAIGAVGDLVLNDADQDRLPGRGPPPRLAQRRRRADAFAGDRRQVAVVGQPLQDGQFQRGGDPEQQVRPGLFRLGEEVVAEEARRRLRSHRQDRGAPAAARDGPARGVCDRHHLYRAGSR